MGKISASLLSCDHMRLGEQALAAEQAGVHFFHIDVMDGHYVENLAFSPQTVTDLKKLCSLPISVHLETFRPEGMVPMFLRAGADIITFQLDACPNPIHLLKTIRQGGALAGIGIGPAYPVEPLTYLLHHMDWLILMSVEPGYGGQAFEYGVLEKIRTARQLMDKHGYRVPICVDGGVNAETGRQLLSAGADVLISGSYLFRGGEIPKRVAALM